MKKLEIRLAWLGILTLTALMLLPIPAVVYAEDTCQVIRLSLDRAGGGSSVQIYPENITVPVGTCTVWINFIERREVQVSFRENAKKCIAATDAATGFKDFNLGAGESCYMTDRLSYGKTASLHWIEPGTFTYTIEVPSSEPGTRTGTESAAMLSKGTIELK